MSPAGSGDSPTSAPPEFLDHPGVEFVFIAASGDPRTELGIDVEREKETSRSAETVQDLGLEPQDIPPGRSSSGNGSDPALDVEFRCRDGGI